MGHCSLLVSVGLCMHLFAPYLPLHAADQTPNYDNLYNECERGIKRGHDYSGWSSQYLSTLSESMLYPLEQATRFAELLVRRGKARITFQDIVITAASQDSEAKIKCLVDLGANIHIKNDKNVPLMIALMADPLYYRALNALPLNGQMIPLPTLVIYEAVWADRQACYRGIEALLANGATIDMPGPDNTTPFMVAAVKGFSELLPLFCQANVFLRTTVGDTALHFAAHCSTNNSLIINKLLNDGLDINMTNNHYSTPLMMACSYNNQENVQLLLDRGASVFVADENKNCIATTVSTLDATNPLRQTIEQAAREERAMRVHTLQGVQYCKEAGLPALLINHVLSFMQKPALRTFIYQNGKKILDALDKSRPSADKGHCESRLSFLSTKVQDCNHDYEVQ
jgi:ankyrin repeat protein